MDANLVKLPPNFDIRGQSAAAEWKTWKCMFQDYLIGIGQDEATDRVKLSLLRNMMGPESSKVILAFKMSTKDSEDYNKVLSEIEKYVNMYNEVFERYKFNERKQEEGENFENFYTNLRQLLETCNYSGNTAPLEDQLLRDRIVQGVCDKTLQESLLRIKNLTLDKATDMCRAAEFSKTQVKEMNSTGRKEKTFKCGRCQTTHGVRQCPAFGKKCSKCGKFNHSEDSNFCAPVRGTTDNTTVARQPVSLGELMISKNMSKRDLKIEYLSIYKEVLLRQKDGTLLEALKPNDNFFKTYDTESVKYIGIDYKPLMLKSHVNDEYFKKQKLLQEQLLQRQASM